MIKLEQLTATAASLTDEQLDGLLDFASYLAGERTIDKAPDEVLAAIERGQADADVGRVVDGGTVFEDAARRIAARV